MKKITFFIRICTFFFVKNSKYAMLEQKGAELNREIKNHIL